MEVLRESVLARGSPSQRFRALLVNFKKLRADPPPILPLDDASAATSSGERGEEYSWEDLLHAVAGLCSVALPDMEDSAIYSSLTRSGSKTIVLLSTSRVGELQCPHKQRENRTITTSSETTSGSVVAASQSTGSSCEVENPFLEVFSESDSSDNESVGGEDEFSEGRRRFLEACRYRRSGQGPSGPEETVAGCGCFLRLGSQPPTRAVQVLLLVVRYRWRRAGLGSFLLQTMKDPAVVGEYNALLTFADHKAERFFSTHGFLDDPILTAKYRSEIPSPRCKFSGCLCCLRGIVDDWENSSLMVYIPPFSGSDAATSINSMASLSLCEDSYRSWRELAISSYCEQLSLMQRLRHEVVLLHSKVYYITLVSLGLFHSDVYLFSWRVEKLRLRH
jgi:hypothetical protein